MPTRLFLALEQTQPTTGGDVYDLSETLGASTTIGADQNGFTEAVRFVYEVNDEVVGTNFPTSVHVGLRTGSTEVRWRVARLNSSGSIQAQSDPSQVVNSEGTHTATLSLDTQWQSGDLFAIIFEGNHSGGGNRNLRVSVGHSESYVDVELEEVIVTATVIKTWDGSQWVEGELMRWTGVEWAPAILQRWNGASWEEV